MDGLIVDNFAGGGGASLGLEWALGRSPDIAINHDREAIAMHKANHPDTEHYCQDVWKVDPRKACRGQPVAVAWFSPDCKHHSKAKGGKPVDKKVRDLAWVVVRWAKAVRPALIMLENVEEFRDWGPLITTEDGSQRPCPLRKGLTYRRWKKGLQDLGYVVEERERIAADSGAPTMRKRLYVVARCDGRPIVWPVPTHARHPSPAIKAWRTAADCIDFSLPCPSIFTRDRALVDNTLRRIARGVWRYVIDNPRPFIVPVTHQGDARTYPLDEPLRTITGAHRGELSLIAPAIARIGQTGGGGKYVNGVDEPLTTITTKAEHLLIGAHITKFRGGAVGSAADQPMPTVTANSFIKRPGGAPPLGVVAAFLAKHYGGHEGPGWSVAKPISTVTTQDHHHLVAAHLLNLKGSDRRMRQLDLPLPTVTSGGYHLAEVRAFLIKYYGTATGAELGEPLHTVTVDDRFALVMVEGQPHVIVDIGMRMLTPRELFRAQGFPDSYVIAPWMDDRVGKKGQRLKSGPLTGEAQVRMAGNSVSPVEARALGRANAIEVGIDLVAARRGLKLAA
jgi:DNA (cytosine-5)-methyltransferase 1